MTRAKPKSEHKRRGRPELGADKRSRRTVYLSPEAEEQLALQAAANGVEPGKQLARMIEGVLLPPEPKS